VKGVVKINYQLIINQILALFIIIFVGYILRKNELINEKLNKGLSNLLIEVTLPALIISSMVVNINPELINNIKLISIYSIVIYLGLTLIIASISHFISIDQGRKSVFKFLLIFGNVGYMGYPVINAIYPDFGILYAVIANIPFNILTFTYGIYIFNKDESNSGIQLKKLFNNGVISSLIGLILLLTGLSLPSPISKALSSIGSITFPLSMLIIGGSLAKVKFKNVITDSSLFLLSGLKLVILPLLILIFISQLYIPSIIANILVLLIAMPSAANGVIFAEKFGGDHKYASEGVFITTLLSLFTIPVIIWMIKLF
jgi:predicted permease